MKTTMISTKMSTKFAQIGESEIEFEMDREIKTKLLIRHVEDD